MTYLSLVPSSALEVSISPDAVVPTASQRFRMQCIASVLPGVESPVTIQWLDGEGQHLQEDRDISLGPILVDGTTTTQTVEFHVLRVVHSAKYFCNVSLSSPAVEEPIVATADFTLAVESELLF